VGRAAGLTGVTCLPAAVPDWVDYVGALGGFAGALAGGAALIFAARSAGDSSRSADAAERSADTAEHTLTILREEAQADRAERNRTPDLDAEIGRTKVVGSSDDRPPHQIILELRALNNGDREARNVPTNVLLVGTLPAGVSFGPCKQDGTPEVNGDVIERSPVPNLISERMWAFDFGIVWPKVPSSEWCCIVGAGAGEYTIGVAIVHERKAPTTRWWRLIIPPSGRRVEIIPTDAPT
jgi:hypothetical protein